MVLAVTVVLVFGSCLKLICAYILQQTQNNFICTCICLNSVGVFSHFILFCFVLLYFGVFTVLRHSIPTQLFTSLSSVLSTLNFHTMTCNISIIFPLMSCELRGNFCRTVSGTCARVAFFHCLVKFVVIVSQNL